MIPTRPLVLMSAVLALAMVALLDLLTPSDVGFAPFYLIPVVITAWTFGARAGVVLAALAAGAELLVDSGVLRIDQDEAPALVLAWNTLSSFIALSVFAVVIERFHNERERWRVVSEERTRLLRLLEREFPRPLREIDWVARTFEEALERHELPRAMRDQFQSLRHHSQELSFLANDLIRVGRVRSGDLVFAPETFDLTQVAREAADQTVDRNRVVVRTGKEAVMAHADPEAARHAVSSIIGRLLDASPKDVVDLLVRGTSDEAVIEFVSASGTIDIADLELAEMLFTANHGRLIVAPRGAGIRIHVYLRKENVATAAATDPVPTAR